MTSAAPAAPRPTPLNNAGRGRERNRGQDKRTIRALDRTNERLLSILTLESRAERPRWAWLTQRAFWPI